MYKGVNLSFANTDSPSTGAAWVNMAKDKRISLLESSIQLFSPQIDLNVVEVHDSGQVSIHINSVIDINDRGEFLLNLEEYLKSTIDIGINIWHEPIGDKSSLRNLRGIEVLS
tara:strand:- start:2079 stop:2417 length:339 start_codon:yes stop_codon:yes gene_type:complete